MLTPESMRSQASVRRPTASLSLSGFRLSSRIFLLKTILVCAALLAAITSCGPDGESTALSLKQRMNSQKQSDREQTLQKTHKVQTFQKQVSESPTPPTPPAQEAVESTK